MGDWYFETARSWEDLIAAHEKWVLDYNFQKHLAHEKREDRCSQSDASAFSSVPWATTKAHRASKAHPLRSFCWLAVSVGILLCPHEGNADERFYFFVESPAENNVFFCDYSPFSRLQQTERGRFLLVLGAALGKKSQGI
jgi:hypothetical protein